jgi:taurine dioxygenase
MELTIKPIKPEFGAEITGVDFKQPISPEVAAALNQAWHRYAVLVFRNQPLSPEQFLRVAEVFGEPMMQSIKRFTLPELPLVGFNSTDDLPRKDGKLQVRGENYHTDHSIYPEPPKATALVAVELPDRGGDTQFVDVRWAFDDLPAATRARIVGMRSPHIYESSQSPRSFAKLSPEERAKIPETRQPLVIRHPDSGRPALYMNTGRMEGIVGLPPDEGFALIDQLYRHATQSKYEYRHVWQVGDLVIWDNRSVMHQANADYDPEQRRYLYRIMLRGQALQSAEATAAAA